MAAMTRLSVGNTIVGTTNQRQSSAA